MSWTQDVRAQFPQVGTSEVVYLDNAATTLKPTPVIEAVIQHMSGQTANIHRGAHRLSDRATELFESSRERVRRFLNAKDLAEIVFTSGTTGGINLLANTLGASQLREGDEILLSQMEHHSNIVPWMMLQESRKVKVRFVPVLEDGTLDINAFRKQLSNRTKIVSLVHVSNALGTINPVASLFQEARQVGATTILDAAQSVSMMPLDVQSLNCDFVVFSGHKLWAPTGVGVLYGRKSALEKLPPYQGGGAMIQEVREDAVEYLGAPHRFEAGTPAIAEVIGLGAALKFIEELGFAEIQKHEKDLISKAMNELGQIEGLKIWGPMNAPRGPIISMTLGKAHPSDVGAILDEQGVAVRAGHHCCQPLMRRLGVPGTVRASFSIYSDESEIQSLVKGLKKAKELLS